MSQYTCHSCGNVLTPGVSYTLECKNCESCSLSFDKNGKLKSFLFSLSEPEGKITISSAYNYQEKPIISVRKEVHRKVEFNIGRHHLSRSVIDQESIADIEMKLPFKDNCPHVYRVWDAVKNNKTFL